MLFLDTCGLLAWTLRLGPAMSDGVRAELDQSNPIVSSISACEIAWKAATGKLELGLHPRVYWQRLSNLALEIHDPKADDWFAAASLKWSHRDPADRCIVAQAEGLGATIVTCDQKMINHYPHCAW